MTYAQISRWHALNWLKFAAEEHGFAKAAKVGSISREYHKNEMRRCLEIAKNCRMLPASE